MKLVNGNPSYERLNLPLNKMYLVSKNNKNLTLAKKLFKAIILVPKSKILSRSLRKTVEQLFLFTVHPFQDNAPFLYPLETSEKLVF